jgi:prepilin-type N-terminal cleavage/methylation domain-containing protein
MKKSSGFTLIEILVGIFVFTLLCTAAFLIFSYGLKVSIYNATNVQIQRNASIAMERILTEAKDAVFLPWQTVNYNPKTPPSPVFNPFINEPNNDPNYADDPNHLNDSSRSIFCFTAPMPTSTGAGGFNYTSNTSYRLVCYYVDTSFVPSDPNTHPISNTHALIRRTAQFSADLSSPDVFNLDWTLKTLTPQTWAWPGQPEVIIQMPFPSDSIYFFISHEKKPDYWTSRKVEFQSIYTIDEINDPLSFKIVMILTQYPYGKTTYNKQRLKLDGSVQIRSAYH